MPNLAAETILKEWNDDLRDPMKAQRDTLHEILTNMQTVCSLSERGLGPETSLENFVGKYPLTSYADYEEIIQSVADGRVDPSELIGSHPSEELLGFYSTSGTSQGKSKLIPRPALDLVSRRRMFAVAEAITEREGLCAHNRLSPLRRGRITETPAGFLCGGATSLAMIDPLFEDMLQKYYVSPIEIFRLTSPSRVVVYAHLMAGLLAREEVDAISANFAYYIVEMLLLLEEEWKQIVAHLRSGPTLIDGLVDEASFQILQKLVGSGMPDLASFVEKECEAGFEHIIPRLFPNCMQIAAVTTGSMKSYISRLKYLAGDIPLTSLLYGASEGIVGVNTDPIGAKSGLSGPVYTIAPRCGVFEFLPVDSTAKRGKNPVLLDKVEIGCSYSVIVTTGCGLFRYALGDVVRVVQFEYATPVLEFLYRSSSVMSLHSERMTEEQLTNAFIRAQHESEVYAREFTFDTDRDCLPPRYVVYCELAKTAPSNKCALLANTLDRMLGDQNDQYQSYREEGVLGGLKMALVQTGCFEGYGNSVVEWGSDPSQYKVPRCVAGKKMREHLQKSVLSSFTASCDQPQVGK